MPGLKFRVLLDSEKKEEVFRDILIADTADFESFYKIILDSFDFKGDQMGSFYVSNDMWDKGHEISLMDMTYDDDSIDEPSTVMKSAIIKDFLEEPDQKFILVYDFLSMWIFLVELIGFEKAAPEKPSVLLSIGQAPAENSREDITKDLFSDQRLEGGLDDDDDDDELGFNEFDDDYSDDDLSEFSQYES
jgi:hypothetical protein